MKFIKSHLQYSKSQRNGIFLLLIIMVVIQAVLFYIKWSNVQKTYQIENSSHVLQAKLDSLTKNTKKAEFKIYPFNPNYLSDYKAYQLGMSVKEIDRLLIYRASNQYINSSQEFQKVTKVSDSLLSKISPYFKFPTWVVNKKEVSKKEKKTPFVVKDINKARLSDLIKIKGVGEKRAKTILKYRKLLGGFSYINQLDEVWGIPPDVLSQLKKVYKVLSKPNFNKINVNTASVNQLSKIVYIDYKLANSIIDYREEVAEIQTLEELKIIRDFPVDKFNLISLYLHAY